MSDQTQGIDDSESYQPNTAITSPQQDDNSGAAPVMGGIAGAEDDSTGVDQATQAQGAENAPAPQAGPGASFGADGAGGADQSGTKKIVSYLMGADAAHPQVIDQAGQVVDPQGQMSASDRNLLAIEATAAKGGPQAAWPLVQANRVAYNAQTAFAKTALAGSAQKPPDLRAAVDAANKAQANVLDGSNVTFAAGQGGVTATVKMPGTTQTQQYQLNPQQFSQFLDVGGDGQWDKIMDQGAPQTLARLSQSGVATVGAAPANAAGRNAGKPVNAAPAPTPEPPVQPQAPGASAPAPSGDDDDGPGGSVTQQEYQNPVFSGKLNSAQKIQQRSYEIFPRASLDENENSKRAQWVSAQEQHDSDNQNKVDVAEEAGKQRLKVAQATGQSRENVASTTSQAKLQGWQYASDAKKQQALAGIQAKQQALAATGQNQAAQRALKLVQTKIMAGQELAPNEQKFVDGLPGAAAQPQQQAPQAPAAPARSQPAVNQPPVPGAKQFNGKWYTRGPNGEAVPVQ